MRLMLLHLTRNRESRIRARMLKKCNIISSPEIDSELLRLSQLIERTRVLAEVARIAFFDPRDCYDLDGNLLPIHEMPDEVAASITAFTEVYDERTGKRTTTLRFDNKKHFLTLAGKHVGLFMDSLEVQAGDAEDIANILMRGRERLLGRSDS